MDKELVVLFEAAKKAADEAASEDGGAAEEILCLDSLRELKDFPVNYQILVDSQVHFLYLYMKKFLSLSYFLIFFHIWVDRKSANWHNVNICYTKEGFGKIRIDSFGEWDL